GERAVIPEVPGRKADVEDGEWIAQSLRHGLPKPGFAPDKPSAAHLASRVGVCPGNNESAGERKGGRTTKGNKGPRVALAQGAWAASRAAGTHLVIFRVESW